jgi:hypothetical protein
MGLIEQNRCVLLLLTHGREQPGQVACGTAVRLGHVAGHTKLDSGLSTEQIAYRLSIQSPDQISD